jgi:hypothetical protein
MEAHPGVLAFHEVLVAAQRGHHRHAPRPPDDRGRETAPMAHRQVHDWSYCRAFPGQASTSEWCRLPRPAGSRRRPSSRATMWKGPFHMPRQKLASAGRCWRASDERSPLRGLGGKGILTRSSPGAGPARPSARGARRGPVGFEPTAPAVALVEAGHPSGAADHRRRDHHLRDAARVRLRLIWLVFTVVHWRLHTSLADVAGRL